MPKYQVELYRTYAQGKTRISAPSSKAAQARAVRKLSRSGTWKWTVGLHAVVRRIDGKGKAGGKR